MRTRKAVKNFYKLVYYFVSTLFGWYVLKDSFLLPKAMGGSGEIIKMFTDFPFITKHEYYNFYFISCLGFHTS